jgi:hypothetical protein
MKNLPTGYTCMDCGATHDFPENIALQWNQPVAHTCTCGTACTILKGAVHVLPASMYAALEDYQVHAYPALGQFLVLTGLQPMNKRRNHSSTNKAA